MPNTIVEPKPLAGADAPARPMFTAKAEVASEAAPDSVPASPYVLFEQAPLTGSWILQGTATRALYAAWEGQERVGGLPLLSSFDSTGVADKLPDADAEAATIATAPTRLAPNRIRIAREQCPRVSLSVGVGASNVTASCVRGRDALAST